jgi:hypothetical protein
MGDERNTHTGFLARNLKERGHVEDLDVWEDNIKMGLKERELWHGLDLSGSQ